MMGTSPVTALIGSYIGQVDFFKEEGLDVDACCLASAQAAERNRFSNA
jgi:hypothetical protein